LHNQELLYLPSYLPPTLLFLAVNTVFFALATPAYTQETCPPFDRQPKTWLNNREVQTFVDTPDPICGPSGPTDEKPDTNVYLIAPIDPNRPQAVGGTFPLPNDAFITVPIHDTTFEREVPASQPADCFGSYVLLGPKATSNLVLTREDPNGSGLELAYAIKFGGLFRPLTANWIIRAGVKLGLLRLDSSIGYGGTCWSDSSAQNSLQGIRLNY